LIAVFVIQETSVFQFMQFSDAVLVAQKYFIKLAQAILLNVQNVLL